MTKTYIPAQDRYDITLRAKDAIDAIDRWAHQYADEQPNNQDAITQAITLLRQELTLAKRVAYDDVFCSERDI